MFRRSVFCFRHRWISLGGWCGPSQILAKNGLTTPETQLPFDLVRCTLDGVAEFTKVGFEEYFPPSLSSSDVSFAADPVSIWLLFRGWHTAFTHYDLNRADNQQVLLSRIQSWEHMFRHSPNDVEITCLRTSISQDPTAEMKFVPQLQKVFDEVSGNRLKYRIVLVHHLCKDDIVEKKTKPIALINERAVMWQLAHDDGNSSSSSLFDKSESGYNQVIEFENNVRSGKASYDAVALKETAHEIVPRLKKSELLSRVEGIPTFLGTCTGFGSTQSRALNGVCLSCGDRSGHLLRDRTLFDTKREWSQDEDDRMIEMVLLLQNPQHAEMLDVVALVEKTANDLGRGANEVLERFKEFGLNTNL
jgi:hypothetical protein